MSDNQTPEQELPGLRKAYDSQKVAYEALQVQYSQLLASTTFEKAGLNPKHAELFLKVNGDQPITAEAAKKFAEDYNLQVASQEPVSTETPAAQPLSNTPLASLAGAGTQPSGAGAGSPQGPKLSQAEFQKLYINNKAEALKAYTEGRVEHASGNPIVQDAVNAGLIAQ